MNEHQHEEQKSGSLLWELVIILILVAICRGGILFSALTFSGNGVVNLITLVASDILTAITCVLIGRYARWR